MLLLLHDFQYLRQLALALLELLPLVMQSQSPAIWTGYSWSQTPLMHCKMFTSWCLSANHPVMTLLLCEVWEHVPSRGMIWKPAHSAQSLGSSCRHSPRATPPMFFLKVHHGQMGGTPLNTVQGTAFANSSVNTTEFTEKQILTTLRTLHMRVWKARVFPRKLKIFI